MHPWHPGKPVREIAAKVDTVMFCLSKALGAPVGSIIAGPRPLMERGRLLRKRLGGGMRQVGVLAAAGMIALEQGPAELPNDHANARFIADRLAEIEGVKVFPGETNIVVFDVSNTGNDPRALSASLKERGILMNAIGGSDRLMRAVTHRDVTRDQCAQAVSELATLLKRRP